MFQTTSTRKASASVAWMPSVTAGFFLIENGRTSYRQQPALPVGPRSLLTKEGIAATATASPGTTPHSFGSAKQSTVPHVHTCPREPASRLEAVAVAAAAETQLAILGEAALLVVATTKQWKLTTMMVPATTVMISTTELNTFATVLFNGAQGTSTTGISVTPSLLCDSLYGAFALRANNDISVYCLSAFRSIFPRSFFGSSSANSTHRGYL
jgi:hypothetical protein